MKTKFVAGKVLGNQYFLLGNQPSSEDNRSRNAFGILKSFGKAYAAYYRRLDRQRTRSKGN